MDDEIKKKLPASKIDHLTIAEVRALYASDQLSTAEILDAIGFDRGRILVSGWGRTDLPSPLPETDFFAIGVRPEDEAAVEAMLERLRSRRREEAARAAEERPEE